MSSLSTNQGTPSRFSRLWNSNMGYSFRRNPVAMVSFAVFLVITIASVLAPVLAPFDPYDPAQIDIMNSEYPPVWIDGSDSQFVFGTDDQGRDLWSTILYGTRLSLLIGLCAVALQAFLGISIGLVAGYVGGRLDSLLMRFADIQLSFSTLMVAIIFLAVTQAMFGSETFNQYAIYFLIAVIGVAEWPQYARTVRATVLAEKKKEYIDSARVLGFGPMRIMVRHILPNSLSPIFVISTVQVANAIISEASLSFLGLGMPPSQPSLGSLISSGFDYIFSGSWWITAIPGVVLVVLVLVINLLGDWMRDVLNPKLYKG
ncbi:ABC transporter permease [Phaeobacter gallaeciensis]|uniref:Dipeptide transport system permease protein DppC n=1 Tax=Phaeobacter gallaeciensis TaxID=60890 RepID=A0AAC9ZCF1_9RHOB|nr:ABC transporter permease [Phaeobacter gallaeciensis]AHD11532.1 ABC-type dipeptide/oligopeptide/nickel transport system, permease component [Phaeobacter gallaeciensis DSM 26640]ATE94796.1 dipeptide transport system permease protein DppC [Phaeobacter gallaeciensis]ATE99068.1 dipeptide transport system permease protein DppC [Phaeobacter gallaeciensis]ATF03460.1 dipeptide transport system permease protein DppC [Phaeobacter gallaeciensis]ATF07840.1 dipeptide transport system permease protein Dpp